MYEFYVKNNDGYKLIYQSTNHSTVYLWRYLYNSTDDDANLDSFFFKFNIESLHDIFFDIHHMNYTKQEEDVEFNNTAKEFIDQFFSIFPLWLYTFDGGDGKKENERIELYDYKKMHEDRVFALKYCLHNGICSIEHEASHIEDLINEYYGDIKDKPVWVKYLP